jgi:hypothetical protein
MAKRHLFEIPESDYNELVRYGRILGSKPIERGIAPAIIGAIVGSVAGTVVSKIIDRKFPTGTLERGGRVQG